MRLVSAAWAFGRTGLPETQEALVLHLYARTTHLMATPMHPNLMTFPLAERSM